MAVARQIKTVPSFSRVEIGAGSKDALLRASVELKNLAGELEFIAGQRHSEEEAIILAHHKIKATSQKLRGV